MLSSSYFSSVIKTNIFLFSNTYFASIRPHFKISSKVRCTHLPIFAQKHHEISCKLACANSLLSSIAWNIRKTKIILFHNSIRQPNSRNASPSLLLSRALCVNCQKLKKLFRSFSKYENDGYCNINHDFLYAVLKVVQTREINYN